MTDSDNTIFAILLLGAIFPTLILFLAMLGVSWRNIGWLAALFYIFMVLYIGLG